MTVAVGVPQKTWEAFRREAERRGFCIRLNGELAFRSVRGKVLKLTLVKGCHRLVECDEKEVVMNVEVERPRRRDRLVELKRRRRELKELGGDGLRDLLGGKRIRYLRYAQTIENLREEQIEIDEEIEMMEHGRKIGGKGYER